jgi:TonB-linked SusC/RagA family outer membrane protein
MRKLFLILSAMFCLLVSAIAQNRTITGRVTDETGQGVPRASVLVKGTRIGTTTDADGNFTLNTPSGARTLVISSVNMANQEVAITGSNVNVTLTARVNSLEDVVVVGYGTQKKTESTSSVTKISGDKVANTPFASVDQPLQGKVAGLQTSNFSGQPGASQSIRIRGVGSYSLSNQPLFVVDGVMINSGDLSRLTTTSNVLANLNPNDIENISVLKDASATAIYGSQGSNGVIIITTRRGRAGKTKVNFSTEIGQNRHIDIPAAGVPLRSADWLALFKESIVNAGYSQATADATAANYGDGSVDVNWLDVLTRTGTQQTYNLSLQGGDEKTKFYISGGYYKQAANVIGSDLKRYSSVINLDHNISKKFSVGLSLQPSYSRENAPVSNSSAFANPIMAFYFLRPLQNPYAADGSFNIGTATKDFSSTFNPLYIVANDIHTLDYLTLNGNVQAKYNIVKGLSFLSKIGMQYNNLEEYYYNNPAHGDGKGSNGRGYSYLTRYFLYDWVNQFDYHTTVLKDFRLDAVVGYEALTSKQYNITAQQNNFATPLLVSAATASTPIAGSSSNSDYAFLSEYGRLNLNYKDRYSIQASVRRDGSSKFSQKNEFGWFPSIAGAWNIAKENFFSSQNILSNLKLRASYGITGNSNGLSNYGWRQLFGYGLNYNGQPGGGFNTIGNTELQWESGKQTDVGLEASFLKDRIGFVFDWYSRITDELIFSYPLSQVSGFSSITKNIGAIKNTGVEFTLNATPVKTRDFTWDLSFNITHNKNRVTKIPPTSPYIANGSFIVMPGHDINEFYMREWAGVDPQTGNPLWYADSALTKTTSVFASAPVLPVGKSASPKYYGGLSNTFTYKFLNLTVDFYYNFGNYVQDAWAFYLSDEVSPSYGKYSYILNRWQKPGDITNVPRLIYGGVTAAGTSYSSTSNSTRFLYKGDYIRLRNIQLGFNVPSTLSSRMHISNLSFYVRGTNLWSKIYDKDIPFDPEQGISSQTNLNFFQNRTVTVGLTLGL